MNFLMFYLLMMAMFYHDKPGPWLWAATLLAFAELALDVLNMNGVIQ